MTKTIEIPLNLWRANISFEAKRYYIDLLAYNSDKVIGEKAPETVKEELKREGFLPLPKKTVTLEQVKEVLKVFNDIKGTTEKTGFQPIKTARANISAQIKIWGVQTCKDVVEYKSYWFKNPKEPHEKNWFSPKTIFRPSNFDNYRVEMESNKQQSGFKTLKGFRRSN